MHEHAIDSATDFHSRQSQNETFLLQVVPAVVDTQAMLMVQNTFLLIPKATHYQSKVMLLHRINTIWLQLRCIGSETPLHVTGLC